MPDELYSGAYKSRPKCYVCGAIVYGKAKLCNACLEDRTFVTGRSE